MGGIDGDLINDPVCRVKACCCCSCCLSWFIVFIVLLATSLKTLSQGEVGILFKHWTQHIDGDPMTEPGLKNVGPLNGLVRYPSVYQLVYFDNFAYSPKQHEVMKPPVHSRTYDGLQVYVKVSFQWKLEPMHLEALYGVLGGAEDLINGERTEDKPSFVEAIVRFARGTLTSICSQYTASQFFANQSLVEQRMRLALQEDFNHPEKGLMIQIAGLQLRSVDLPDRYEEAIAETQKEEQDFQTAMAERATNVMKVDSELMQAQKRQDELKVDMMGTVRAIEEENAAWVQQYVNFQTKQADSYATVLNSLGNSSSGSSAFTSLFELMKQKALKGHATSKLVLSA